MLLSKFPRFKYLLAFEFVAGISLTTMVLPRLGRLWVYFVFMVLNGAHAAATHTGSKPATHTHTHPELRSGTWHFQPNPKNSVACKIRAQLEYARVACTFLHALAPTRMLGRCFVNRISASELGRKFVKSSLFG